MTASLFGVVGWKKPGQAYRGFHRSVKQVHHVLDIDQEGRDFFRYRAAGLNRRHFLPRLVRHFEIKRSHLPIFLLDDRRLPMQFAMHCEPPSLTTI